VISPRDEHTYHFPILWTMLIDSFSETGIFLIGPTPWFCSLFDPPALLWALFQQLRGYIGRSCVHRLDYFLPLVIGALEADVWWRRRWHIASGTLRCDTHSWVLLFFVFSCADFEPSDG
jgi:hypothetical protein